MRAVIIRHAEVNYSIPQIVYQKIYISELSRSKDTAKILFPMGEYLESQLINEVPLKSSFDTKMNILLWFWNLTGRLQWFLNCRRFLPRCSSIVVGARITQLTLRSVK